MHTRTYTYIYTYTWFSRFAVLYSPSLLTLFLPSYLHHHHLRVSQSLNELTLINMQHRSHSLRRRITFRLIKCNLVLSPLSMHYLLPFLPFYVFPSLASASATFFRQDIKLGRCSGSQESRKGPSVPFKFSLKSLTRSSLKLRQKPRVSTQVMDEYRRSRRGKVNRLTQETEQ